MAYFEELPDLEVKARFPNQSTNSDYIKIKNLWRRGKLREDIANAVTAFYYYQIEGDDRPDQIADKIYDDPELDWVILLVNNIINVNDEWPMNENTLYKYLIDKYGSEEKLSEVHHTETIESRDEFNRVIIPEKLNTSESSSFPNKFVTILNKEDYSLTAFPPLDTINEVTINFIQALNVKQIITGDTLYSIQDINTETSNLKVYTRENGILDIEIENDLENNWASSWGGTLKVYGRTEIKIINIEDITTDYKLILSPRLYEVVGIYNSDKDEIIPTFKFRYSV